MKNISLSGAKKALFAQRLKGQFDAQENKVPHLDGQSSFPLSHAQERLWFLDQLEPNLIAYHVPNVIRLKGKLQVDALSQSVRDVVGRHDSLRTVFAEEDGQPMQRVVTELEFAISLEEIDKIGEKEQSEFVDDWVRQDLKRPFDLRRGPLFRAKLLKIEPEHHVLLLIAHHIVFDAWSIEILTREIIEYYSARVENREASLPQLSIQYGDYAVWHRQRLEEKSREKEMNYWKEKLKGEFPLLDLPTDQFRPTAKSYRGGTEPFRLSEKLSQQLEELSLNNEVTLHMLLLAAFRTLLYRYTEQGDILIGVPITGRNRTELENLIGFIVNTLILRNEVMGKESFPELLRREREAALEAYSHQDIPFERLVKELKPERDMSRNPLFQVMFVFQDGKKGAKPPPGIQIEEVPINWETSKFDLTLFISNAGGVIHGHFEYSTELFFAETIQRMVGHWEELLKGILTHPEKSVQDLPMLTDRERRQILDEFNATDADYPQSKTIHQLFEEQAEKIPQKIAVVAEEQELNYGELNRRANQLARHLVEKHKIGKGDLVAIYGDRCLEMVVVIFGVLKSGASYLPLDSQIPADRADFIIEDSGAKALINLNKKLHSIKLSSDRHIDYKVECFDQYIEDNLNQEQNGDPTLYIMYTSGSTGKPKGVMVGHKAVINILYQMQNLFAVGTEDAYLFKTAFSFDVSILELFAWIIGGGKMVVASKGSEQDPHLIYQMTERYGITHINFVPSMLTLHLEQFGFVNVRFLMVAGEVFTQHLSAEINRRAFSGQVINMYGATETFYASYHIANTSEDHCAAVPIGKPFKNVRMYVLDSQKQLLPIGLRGEIYVGGDSLATGYVGNPALTGASFMEIPIGGQIERVWRTGDLGKLLPDGNTECLGRRDHQIKIRGYRIELEEVESVLCHQLGVKEAVVTVYKAGVNDARLCAYIVGEQVELEHLKVSTAKELPHYMMPVHWTKLKELPLTATGKIDRKLLPEPQDHLEMTIIGYVAPQTPVESVLVKIWEDVLKLKNIGVEHNFFQLGGHSLLIIRMLGLVKKQLKSEISLKEFFHEPTIAAMSQTLCRLDNNTGKLEEIAKLRIMVDQMSNEQVNTSLREKPIASQKSIY